MNRSIWLILLMISSANAKILQSQASCPEERPYTSMKLTFDSEFTQQQQLDPMQWRIFIGQHGPAEQEANVYLPENIHLQEGLGLNLQIEQKSIWDHSYTAGWIETRGRFSQTYGHYEMLARVPEANGVWPAFWLAPENGSWPPEIDILEYVFAPHGKHPDPMNPAPQSIPETTLHWMDSAGNHQFQHAGADALHPRYYVGLNWDHTPPMPGMNSQFTGYHLYAVDWRPGQIAWYIDHHSVFCITDTDVINRRVPDEPMYIILSDSVAPLLQKSTHWAGQLDPEQIFPLNYKIAFVRAYQYTDIAPIALPLDLLQVLPPATKVHPGQDVNMQVMLRVNHADLGKGKVALSLYTMLDPHQFYGMGKKVGEVDATIPALMADHSYHLEMRLSIPSTIGPGIYGIDVKANYTTGPGNMLAGPWPRGIHDRQAATITVLP